MRHQQRDGIVSFGPGCGRRQRRGVRYCRHRRIRRQADVRAARWCRQCAPRAIETVRPFAAVGKLRDAPAALREWPVRQARHRWRPTPPPGSTVRTNKNTATQLIEDHGALNSRRVARQCRPGPPVAQVVVEIRMTQHDEAIGDQRGLPVAPRRAGTQQRVPDDGRSVLRLEFLEPARCRGSIP